MQTKSVVFIKESCMNFNYACIFLGNSPERYKKRQYTAVISNLSR